MTKMYCVLRTEKRVIHNRRIVIQQAVKDCAYQRGHHYGLNNDLTKHIDKIVSRWWIHTISFKIKLLDILPNKLNQNHVQTHIDIYPNTITHHF